MAPRIATRPTRRDAGKKFQASGEICVVGSGAAGMSAALEAARLGRRVVLVEAAPALGGQAVGGLIGTFCGLYSNGPAPYRVTYGVANGLLEHLFASGGATLRRARNSMIVMYDEVKVARWIEEQVRQAPITVLLGAVLRDVTVAAGRITALDVATRWGDVAVEAEGFVDASGDAALAWAAGLELQEPDAPIYGTQMITIEGVDQAALTELGRDAVPDRLKRKAAAYGLVRRDGFVFAAPTEGVALANMTHIPTPTDPAGAAAVALEGRAQADRLLEFLRAEFDAAFGGARIRAYGLPGIRQSRWITGSHRLTVDAVRQGTRPADAIARCSWPLEIHHAEAEVYWEEFGDDHMHYVPLGSLTPKGVDNLVAAGRCIDADVAALSSVRVMGPCMAMGAAAAHALDLAGAGSVHQIDVAALQQRLADNLERSDPDPWSPAN